MTGRVVGRLAAVTALLVGLVGLASNDALGAPAEAPPASPERKPPAGKDRQLYFGDLHVHSSWSFDAYLSGVTAPPEDAYRYARGQAIDHISGQPIRLEGPPLDFLALTEHAEYLGVVQASQQPEHPLRRQPLIRSWLSRDPTARRAALRRIRDTFSRQKALPALVSDAVVQPAWQSLVRLAQAENRPGEFTSFVGFEYTATVEGRNLHRNVLFRGAEAPARPFSAMDSRNPEDLWRWMDGERAAGRDVLAIPHNPNGSDGWMFARQAWEGRPIDPAWIALRARNEPLSEILQIKGQSETHPSLSPDDEWADFAVLEGRTLWPAAPSRPAGSYWRDALKRGLSIEATQDANPYRLGVVGSTDGHNAASPFEERNYSGKLGRTDGTAEARLRPMAPGPGLEPVVSLATQWGSAAGLAGVWAEANERGVLFDALRRRETFGTSGPRIRLRLFAGWDFSEAEAAGDHATVGYARGVPMGGVLAAPSHDRGEGSAEPAAGALAPVLLVRAQQDPASGALERLQIVKGWERGGETFERVIDVACLGGAEPDPETRRCPAAAASPKLPGCVPAPGAAELSARWRDPDYDPSANVFYYARVLEVPTCRWSAWDAIRLERKPPEGVPAFIQERAIGSPVWVPPLRHDAATRGAVGAASE